MLKYLRLQNIILVDDASMYFHSGLNVLTGETGSGKSAMMHGLNLATGERADASLIRKGYDKGVVEAIFEIKHTTVLELLCDAGLGDESNDEILIRREISSVGKGRIFINHRVAQLSFLRKLGQQLVQIVGQHANHRLLSLDMHREMLDLYGNSSTVLNNYQVSYDRELDLINNLERFSSSEAQRLRDIDQHQRELEELEEAYLVDGEEETLFADYTLLSHAEEMLEKIGEIKASLSSERQSVLGILNRHKNVLATLACFDSTLDDSVQALQNIFLELQELSYTIEMYHSRLDNDPKRLSAISNRLDLINRLKRKYGGSITEIIVYKSQLQTKLHNLINMENDRSILENQLHEIHAKTQMLAAELSYRRSNAAIQLARELTSQLNSLNMFKAEFHIEITQQKRSRYGNEKIEFYLSPNQGENQISLKNGISGGELARVSLALQTLLAGKEKVSTLIFDEIDANIGGETARIIGDELRKISQHHQVICITHFPQVAKQADYHLQISKQEKEGRTVSYIQPLDNISRLHELGRMAGLRTGSSHDAV